MENQLFGLLFVAGVFWLGLVIGRFQAIQRLVKGFMQDPDRIQKLLKELEHAARQLEQDTKKESSHEELRVERAGSQIYLYHKNTDEFLAQGETLQEALDRVEKRFPNRSFAGHLTKEQVDSLGITVTK